MVKRVCNLGLPKFDPEPKDVLTALKNRQGVLTYAAYDLKVSRWTLTKWINEHPEIKTILQELRDDHLEQILDRAEHSLSTAVDLQEKDWKSCLNAVFYVLNNQGKRRGYAHPNSETNLNKVDGLLDKWDKTFVIESNTIEVPATVTRGHDDSSNESIRAEYISVDEETG